MEESGDKRLPGSVLKCETSSWERLRKHSLCCYLYSTTVYLTPPIASHGVPAFIWCLNSGHVLSSVRSPGFSPGFMVDGKLAQLLTSLQVSFVSPPFDRDHPETEGPRCLRLLHPRSTGFCPPPARAVLSRSLLRLCRSRVLGAIAVMRSVIAVSVRLCEDEGGYDWPRRRLMS